MPFAPPSFPETFNLATYFLDDRLREGRGGATALVACDARGGVRRLTYAEVAGLANAMAETLRERGVGYEDRVLLALPDTPAFAAAFFGVLKAGAVVTMVNTELPVEDYAYYLEYTRARVLVTTEELAAKI